jgi:hypothetical protein
MKIDSNILTAIIGVIGVLFGTLVGALLSGIGHILKSRAESKKVLNQNIFNLFQIWHIISILEKYEIDNVTNLYIDKIRKLYPDQKIPGDQDAEIQKLFSDFLSQFLSSFLQKIDTPFKENYYTGVSELSKFAPVLAYDLSNNRYINDFLNHFEVISHSIFKQKASENPSADEEQFFIEFNKGLQASKKWVTKDFSKDLQKDIIKLSWKNGILSWLSCKRKINKRLNIFKDKNINKSMDQYIQETIKPLLVESKQITEG